MKKEKKCPKCNAPYSKFSLKICKLKVTDSLLCEKCDKEKIEKVLNKQWAKWKKQMEFDPDTWVYSRFYGTFRVKGAVGSPRGHIRERR